MDSAQIYTAAPIQLELNLLDSETVRHLPYSPDRADGFRGFPQTS